MENIRFEDLNNQISLPHGLGKIGDIKSLISEDLLSMKYKENLALLNYKNLTDTVINNYPEILQYRGVILNLTNIFHGKGDYLLNYPIFKFKDVDYLIENYEYIIDITEKYDGCMLSNYFLNNEMYWTSRENFTSEITDIANNMWRLKYKDKEELISKDLTLVCEFIHKKSKILIDYDFEDFVLIRVVNRNTGYIYNRLETEKIAKLINMKIAESVDMGIDKMLELWNNMTTESEGYVINFEDGYSLKLSNHFYNLFYDVVTVPHELNILTAWLKLQDHNKVKFINHLPTELQGLVISLFNKYDELSRGENKMRFYKKYKNSKNNLDVQLMEIVSDDL